MGEGGDGGEENMAAWLLGINNLKVLPYKLPPLGIYSLLLFSFPLFDLFVHYLLKYLSFRNQVVPQENQVNVTEKLCLKNSVANNFFVHREEDLEK
ncbi:hypothetical protein M5K25_022444 [Dendrobium thyrsiflorum]|uniref:Uncharacterized protein n=1 Tax=Dendrobium thyrsiflorum TaxID=117978 RepID=A0ABD0U646_DENTH